MKSFNTLNEMVEAYKNQFNAGYSDTSKHFTTEEVATICVHEGLRINLKAQYKINIATKTTKVISGFGYVNA